MLPLLLALAIQSAAPSPATQGDAPAVAASRTAPSGPATAAAQRWLGLVDTGDYAQSWQTAGAVFRQSVSQDQWTQQLPDVRRPLGPLVSRHAEDGEEIPPPPENAPNVEYHVIRFDSDFTAKKGLIETVVTDEEQGEWRVVGYFIADPSAPAGETGTSPPDSTRR